MNNDSSTQTIPSSSRPRVRSPRGLLNLAPYAVNRAFLRLRQFVDTARGRLWAKWWGIVLGPYSAFFGLPIFRRHPTATISIGSHAAFRSAEWSNTIGLNRRCVISAERGASIRVGHHCGFSGAAISASASIVIGDRVLCGANCTIADTDRHPLDAAARAAGLPVEAIPVVIEDDVWLGMNVVVLKGCRIGKGTVVAANSVVTRSLPGGALCGGVPARVIKELR